MSVICLINNKRANSDFQQEAHRGKEILKAKTDPRPSPEVGPEVTGEPASFRSLPGLNSKRPDHREGA